MTEIPTWWLGVSGAFFIFGILVFLAIIIALLKVLSIISALHPQITETIQRVNSVATKVEDVTDQVKSTVDDLSIKAKGIANTTEGAVGRVASAAAANSPWVAGVMMAIKIFTTMRHMKQAKKALPAPKKGAGH